MFTFLAGAVVAAVVLTIYHNTFVVSAIEARITKAVEAIKAATSK